MGNKNSSILSRIYFYCTYIDENIYMVNCSLSKQRNVDLCMYNQLQYPQMNLFDRRFKRSRLSSNYGSNRPTVFQNRNCFFLLCMCVCVCVYFYFFSRHFIIFSLKRLSETLELMINRYRILSPIYNI